MGEACIEKKDAYKISAGNILISWCQIKWIHRGCPDGRKYQCWLPLQCTPEAKFIHKMMSHTLYTLNRSPAPIWIQVFYRVILQISEHFFIPSCICVPAKWKYPWGPSHTVFLKSLDFRIIPTSDSPTYIIHFYLSCPYKIQLADSKQ